MSEDTEQKMATKRRVRAAARETAIEQADKDGAMRKGNEKDAKSSVPPAVVPARPQTMSKKERRAAAQKAAAAQAERDALVKAPAPALQQTVRRDHPPTLHELNMQARARDREMRSEARDAAAAAGKAAFEVLSGRSGVDARHTRRFKTIAASEKQMVEAQRRAAQEAAKG